MNKSIIPPFLKKGDKVALISPSGVVEPKNLIAGRDIISSWGLEPLTGQYAFHEHGIFAGTDDERLSDLLWALDDSEVRAIICSRGGHGLTRVIDQLKSESYIKHPKWIVGYSDITALHLWSNGLSGVSSLHGEMAVNFGNGLTDPDSGESLRRALFGEDISVKWSGDTIRPSKVRGEITGGNLALITALTGTPFEIMSEGKILFIEETGEYLYRVDRMLNSIKLAGKLKGIKALLIGGLDNIQEGRTEWGITAEDLITEFVQDFDFPVFFGFPAGHRYLNRALYFGVDCTIEPKESETRLKFNF